MLFYLCIILTDPATITLVHLRIRDDVQKNKNIVYDFFVRSYSCVVFIII